MKKTVVRLFTTKFNMQRLFLRGMTMSPLGRYLAFVVDDQVNWDVVRDGAEVTRIHFHQLGNWTADDSKRALMQLTDSGYRGDLQFNLWELVDGESLKAITDLADYLRSLDMPHDSPKHRQRLFMLNLIGCVMKGDQRKALVGEARNQALDRHVNDLFDRVSTMKTGHIWRKRIGRYINQHTQTLSASCPP
ncbi:hypothetical protein H4S02_005730 [Coemansia sp. RSA 2611]|nr:hypothetical protein H4S02_005730 [Coemansia sp. RSA 2611]